MSDLMVERNVFERKVEKLLDGKPERYKQIIYSHIERHQDYLSKLGNNYCDIDVVISYMVQLDRTYVSIRDDNE